MVLLQVLQHYLSDINTDVISHIQLEPDADNWVPCDPENTIYGRARTYWCSDMFVHEEQGNSSISNDDHRMHVHQVNRQRVQLFWSQRGSLH